jgi:hypothetical protein
MGAQIRGIASKPSSADRPSGSARLTNLSIRTNAGAGAQTLIVGFNLSGNGTKPLLIRGIGPTLASFGVSGLLADPRLQLYNGSTLLVENDNWGGGAAISNASAGVGAFALPASSRDAVLLQTMSTGSYTAQVGGGTGVALVEIYETGNETSPKLVNVSARTGVGTGANLLISGFVISGQGSKTLLIRAIGPTLRTFGVTGELADPRLELYRGSSLLQSNDNWNGNAALSAAFTSVGAFGLPVTSRDAALLVTLPPGSYTVQVSGVNNSIGIALVELYEMP